MGDFEGPKMDFEALSLKGPFCAGPFCVVFSQNVFHWKDDDIIPEIHGLLHSKT